MSDDDSPASSDEYDSDDFGSEYSQYDGEGYEYNDLHAQFQPPVQQGVDDFQVDLHSAVVMDDDPFEGIKFYRIYTDRFPSALAMFTPTSVVSCTLMTGEALLLTAREREKVTLTLFPHKLVCNSIDGVVLHEIGLDSTCIQDQMELLPDFARRSRHQGGLFPFFLMDSATTKQLQAEVLSPSTSVEQLGILIAVHTSKAMWQWAKAIRWRGSRPTTLVNPPNLPIDRETTLNDHYTVAKKLQELLLWDDFYKHNRYSYEQFQRSVTHACIGACIHRAERNVELVLSTNLVDLAAASGLFNSPLSMLCEGHYSASRSHIAYKLVENGHKVGRGVMGAGKRFVSMLCKPTGRHETWWWMNAKLRNLPVHDDDKKLVSWLIALGDGIEDNEALQAALKQACNARGKYFEFHARATVFSIPKEIFPWAFETLRELNLQGGYTGCLTTLPDEFYQLANLEVADLSENSIWEISPAIQHMKSLTALAMHNNCLDALPEELELLPKLKKFTCEGNRILYPPQAVVSMGFNAIKNFFVGIRTHGRTTNTEMKVLVVGLSEAGKTSLINVILTGESHLVRRGDRTVGIEQKKWAFKRDHPRVDMEGLTYEMVSSEWMEDLEWKKFGLPFDICFKSNATSKGRFTDTAYILPAPASANKFDSKNTSDSKIEFNSVQWDRHTRMFKATLGELVIRLRFANNFESIPYSEFTKPTTDVDLKELGGKMNMVPFERKPDMQLNMFDFAGQQEYYATHHCFLTERALYVLAFDASRFSSTTFRDQIQYWVDAIQDRVPGAKLLICGTHSDLLPPGGADANCEKVLGILTNKQRRVKKVFKRREVEATKRLKQIDEIRNKYAITALATTTYVEVATLEDIMKRGKSDVEALNFTDSETTLLTALKTLAASKEALSNSLSAEAHALDSSLMMLTRLGQQQLELPSKIIAVSSSTGLSGITDLSNQIKEAVQDKTFFPEVDEEIPLFYSQVRRTVRSLRNESKYWFMHRDDYISLIRSKLNLVADEVVQATQYLHALGEVMWYDKQSTLDVDVVFLKVDYLVDAMKYIIRHDHTDATIYRETDEKELGMNKEDFETAKMNLLEYGHLSVQMLERLWAPPSPDGLGLTLATDSERFFTLASILQKFEIAAVVATDAVGKPKQFIVPE